MKSFSVMIVAAIAGVAFGQLDAFPACGLSCLTAGLPKTGCSITNFKCSCENKEFIESSTACIQSGCSEADQKKALDAAVGLCKSAGVIINPPVSTPKPSSSAAPDTPKPSSSAAPGTPKPSSSAAPGTPKPSSSAAPPTDGYPTASSPAVPAPSSSTVPKPSTPSSSTVPKPSTPSNGTNSTNPPPVQTQEPNAAGRATAVLSLAGLGMLAAFAL